MKPFALLSVSILTLGATACAPKGPATVATLKCPTAQGDLTRTGVAADGAACTYVTTDGAEVTLQRIAVLGSPEATLQALEDKLLAGRSAPPKTASEDASKTTAEKSAAEGTSADSIDDEVQAAVDEAMEDSKGSSVSVKIGKDAHGVIVADDEHGHTRVNLPGIHISADDNSNTADVRIGPLSVNASDDGAKVRVFRPVRLKGEALVREKRGIRATLIYSGSDLPNGYRVVGYEAGGPRIGPLTVAVMKSKSGSSSGDDVYSDVKSLVRMNGGV